LSTFASAISASSIARGTSFLKDKINEAINFKSGPCLLDIITQPLQDANAPVSEWIA